MYLSFINYRTENAVVGEAHFRWNGQCTTRTVTCLFHEEKRFTFQLADQLAASRDKTVSSLLKKHLVFVFNRRNLKSHHQIHFSWTHHGISAMLVGI